MVYRNGWVLVNDVPTKIHTWGGWVEDNFSADSLIIFITGNPGLPMFYKRFLSCIHQKLNVPIWITSHSGHEVPSSEYGMHMKLPKEPSLYNMSGQIAHKLALVRQFVPTDTKLYFIGHSLGAKIISELLNNPQISDQSQYCYMLMPTLEHIRLTPNGYFLNNLLYYLKTLILLLAWIFTLFSDQCRKFLIRWWFYITGQSEPDSYCMEAIIELIQPQVLSKVFNLALDEMDKIKELDTKVLKAHCSKIRLYYAREDGWSPLSHMEHLRQVNPQLSITVLGPQFSHSFVLENPDELGTLLSHQINSDMHEQ